MRSGRKIAVVVGVAVLALAGCSAITGSSHAAKGHGGKNHHGASAPVTAVSPTPDSSGVSSPSSSSSDTTTTDPFSSPTTITVPNTLAPTSTPAAAAVASATLGKHRGHIHVARVGGTGRGSRRSKKQGAVP